MPDRDENQKRVVVLPAAGPDRSGLRRTVLISLGAIAVLLTGVAIGHRAAGVYSPPPDVAEVAPKTSQRVAGGLYALELATPKGQSRWMLEFDAEVVTKDGPTNPIELRNALEQLVIAATSMPLVQAAEAPEEAARKAMLAVAAQDFPWLLDIYLTRSDLRRDQDKLGGIGRALRGLDGG